MAQTLADYLVLADNNITLSEDGEHEIAFTLPDDLYTAARGVLAYMVDPSSGSAKQYEVDINDTVVDADTLSNTEPRGMLEMVDIGILKVGDNTIQFRFEDGGGQLTFKDVVLWYQRTVS